MKFIDSTEIFVASGKGGDGLVSFKTASNKPRLGPDGGDGGHGGDVIFVAAPQLNTLSSVRYKGRYIAENGGKGGTSGKTGKTGADAEVLVPLGTEIYDTATGRLICEILVPGQQEIVCEGGRRGFGNLRFVSSTHQAPEEYVSGQEGRELNLRLELKLLADVGLAGLPNAGKSTLLSVLSAAKPKIADYPFTTLEPQLGVVELRERGEFNLQSFVMADIPGLIEGASEGKGLGHEFLRHLERTKVIAYILDAFPIDGSNPLDTLSLLQNELKSYDEKMFSRRSVVVLNKIDLADGEEGGAERLAHLKKAIENLGLTVFLISGIAKEGLVDLKEALYKLVQNERRLYEAELASRLPVVKGLMSAQALGLSNHGLKSFMESISKATSTNVALKAGKS
jgi:GTP-binding protein